MKQFEANSKTRDAVRAYIMSQIETAIQNRKFYTTVSIDPSWPKGIIEAQLQKLITDGYTVKQLTSSIAIWWQ